MKIQRYYTEEKIKIEDVKAYNRILDWGSDHYFIKGKILCTYNKNKIDALAENEVEIENINTIQYNLDSFGHESVKDN